MRVVTDIDLLSFLIYVRYYIHNIVDSCYALWVSSQDTQKAPVRGLN